MADPRTSEEKVPHHQNEHIITNTNPTSKTDDFEESKSTNPEDRPAEGGAGGRTRAQQAFDSSPERGAVGDRRRGGEGAGAAPSEGARGGGSADTRDLTYTTTRRG